MGPGPGGMSAGGMGGPHAMGGMGPPGIGGPMGPTGMMPVGISQQQAMLNAQMGQMDSLERRRAQAQAQAQAQERERDMQRRAAAAGVIFPSELHYTTSAHRTQRGVPGGAGPRLEDDDSGEESDMISVRTLAMTRYKRNHEIMNEVFYYAAFGTFPG